MWKANPYTNKAGETVFFMRNLFKFRGWTIRIHKFTHADDPGCFHSHPAVAYRLILWGGYVEERLEQRGNEQVHVFRFWKPGQWGKVPPELTHRIHVLIDGPSYSLWIRGPITHKVNYGCI